MSDDPLTPDYIERLAASAGMTVWALCPLAGVHRSQWYRWRRGEACPSVDIVRKLRDAALAASNRKLPSATDIIDPNFTGGLGSEEYLRRLRAGEE